MPFRHLPAFFVPMHCISWIQGWPSEFSISYCHSIFVLYNGDPVDCPKWILNKEDLAIWGFASRRQTKFKFCKSRSLRHCSLRRRFFYCIYAISLSFSIENHVSPYLNDIFNYGCFVQSWTKFDLVILVKMIMWKIYRWTASIHQAIEEAYCVLLQNVSGFSVGFFTWYLDQPE